LLETTDPMERLNRIGDILEIELEKLNVDRNINTRVKRQMERAQKEYYLNEKLKAIRKSWAAAKRANRRAQEEDRYRGNVQGSARKAVQELKRLELMPPMSANRRSAAIIWIGLLAVPWKKRSKEIRDIKAAEDILNREHYGLEKVKERILEFLAVRQLVKNPKGSILCFVGPPGVWQNLVGHVHRPRHRPEICTRIARRGAPTKRKFAGIDAPISARCPARSSQMNEEGRHRQSNLRPR